MSVQPRRIWGVAKRAWPVGLLVIVIVLALAIAAAGGFTEAVFRQAGMLLQAAGLCTVAVGLSQVRRSFNRPTLRQDLASWWRDMRAAFIEPQTISLSTISASASATGASATLSAAPTVQPTLQQRVDRLEADLQELKNVVNKKEAELATRIGAIRDDLRKEQRAREAEDRRIVTKLEDLGVGGLHLEAIGLTWLLAGVVATSIPQELAVASVAVLSWLG